MRLLLIVLKEKAFALKSAVGRTATMIPHCSTFHIKTLTMQSRQQLPTLHTEVEAPVTDVKRIGNSKI